MHNLDPVVQFAAALRAFLARLERLLSMGHLCAALRDACYESSSHSYNECVLRVWQSQVHHRIACCVAPGPVKDAHLAHRSLWT